jgi:hypothetical protein
VINIILLDQDGGANNIYGIYEKYIQNVSQKTGGEGAT